VGSSGPEWFPFFKRTRIFEMRRRFSGFN